MLAALAAILLLGAAVLSLAAWQYAALAARDAYDKLLMGGAVQIAENIFLQGGVVTLDPPAAAIATLSAYDLVFYSVTDPRGIVVAGYGDLTLSASPERLRQGVVLEDGRYQGQPVRIAGLVRKVEGAPGDGWTRIIVAQTLGARAALTSDLAFKALAMIAVMSALALATAALSMRLVFSPLTRIEREIAGRQPDDLSPIALTPPPEARALVEAIDGFMLRLRERIALMQRFIADAAHQIRTPLAAIDAQVELLEADDPAQTAQLEGLRSRIAELGRLTSQLLDHAMVLHRARSQHRTPTDLNQLAKTVLSRAVPLTLDREISISFVPLEEAPLLDVDAISVGEALSNLIHNSVVHGARKRLSLAVERTADGVALRVRDDGPGIPISDQSRLAMPFQKGTTSTGSGLGLAIGDEVARAHGGALRFEGKDGDFSVILEVR